MKNRLKLHIAFLAELVSAAWGRLTSPGTLALGNFIASPGGTEDTKLSDAAIGRRSLVMPGSDENHIVLCTQAGIPIGITRDGSASAAATPVSFAQLGLYSREVEGVANGAIAAGDLLIPGVVAGTVRSLALAGAGTWYICGRAKTAAADGTPVVFVPTFPVQRVV